MSASPSCSPSRRPLDERSSSQINSEAGLGIRLVPYSPPIIGADGSLPSRVVSYADASTETEPEPWTKSPSPFVLATSQRETLSPSPTQAKSHAIGSGSRLSPKLEAPLLVENLWLPASLDDSPRPPSSASAASSPRPSSAPRKTINVHSDKTFSLVPQPEPVTGTVSSRGDSFWASSYTTRASSYGRYSSGVFSEDQQSRPSSPLTPLTERSGSKLLGSSPIARPSPDSLNSSPWNYRLVGGVRKVPKTPDRKLAPVQVGASSSTEEPLPALPEIARPKPIVPSGSKSLVEKTSFQSSVSTQSGTTVSDRTNYKVYRESSPIAVADLDSLPPSSSHSNYRVLGEPSSSDPSFHNQTRPQTTESDANFVTHGGVSSSSSLVAVKRRVRPEFSQESLMVAPLRMGKRSSSEHFGIVKSRSRETMRTGSLSSVSSILTQEATRALFVGPATLLNQGGVGWKDSKASRGTSSKSHVTGGFPHQWSSQLSTVMSESDTESESASRALSLSSMAHRYSAGSRILLGMPSLDDLQEYTGPTSHSRTGSLDPPRATYNKHALRDPYSGAVHIVSDEDENLDVLADLKELRHRPSRTKVGRFLSSYASDRSLRSTASFNAAVPTWAKVYYGSGERRWLAAKASSDSMFSQFSVSQLSDSQFGGSLLSRSPSDAPSVSRTSNIFIPRRRPRDGAIGRQGSRRSRRESAVSSMDITPAPSPLMAVVRSIKKQTSSIWSPHLGRDRRPAEYSMWEPPAADWSARSELSGRRNAQITLFVVGFIFPFAWMMAALVPLSPVSKSEMIEHGHNSTSDLGADADLERQAPTADDEAVYNSARWWRNLNRGMSIAGVLILGAVIALIVVGVQQRWGS